MDEINLGRQHNRASDPSAKSDGCIRIHKATRKGNEDLFPMRA